MKKLFVLIVALLVLAGCVSNKPVITDEDRKQRRIELGEEMKVDMDKYQTIPPNHLLTTYEQLTGKKYQASKDQILNSRIHPEMTTEAGYERQSLSHESFVNEYQVQQFEEKYGEKYHRTETQEAAWDAELEKQGATRKLVEEKIKLSVESARISAENARILKENIAKKDELQATLNWAIGSINDKKMALDMSTSPSEKQKLKKEIAYLQKKIDALTKTLNEVKAAQGEEQNLSNAKYAAEAKARDRNHASAICKGEQEKAYKQAQRDALAAQKSPSQYNCYGGYGHTPITCNESRQDGGFLLGLLKGVSANVTADSQTSQVYEKCMSRFGY